MAQIYDNFLTLVLNGQIDLNGADHDIRIALFTENLTVDLSTHKYYQDIQDLGGADPEVVDQATTPATAYDRGGQALTNMVVTNGKMVADTPSWGPPATFVARYAVLYDNDVLAQVDESGGGGAVDSHPLIALFDFGENKTITAGTFTIQWSPEGILVVGSI